MLINLANLFNGSDEIVKIDYSFKIDDLFLNSFNPIKDKIFVKGTFFQEAGIVQCKLSVSFNYDCFCDRCAEPIHKEMSFETNKVFVTHFENDKDFEDYIVIDDASLNLDEFVREEILLFLPNKILCKENCKGLCPKCGKNLNDGKCDCKKDVDPRMEVLLQLLNEE